MIIQQEAISIENSDPIKSGEFGIRSANMSFILEILRKKMYRDPIRAFVREISCNARDAHREIKTPDRPIEITLPTKIDKQCEIKDFGLGISPHRMWDIFLNYGSSTKRDSNEYTGAFGLGSKIGFSYSDSFSVITVTNGKKRHYTAIIDESRRGRMDLLSEYDTNEPSGTTIILPVKEQDISAFANAAINETTHWSLKHGSGSRPVIINLPASISYPESKTPMLEGPSWELFELEKSYDYYSKPSSLIIIDGIAYNVTDADLELSHDDEVIWARALLQKKLYMYFGIGQLSLASNRDNIHFDDATKKAIMARLGEVRDSIYDHAEKKIQEFADLGAAEAFWAKFTEYLPAYKERPILWKGIDLKGSSRSMTDADNAHMKINKYSYVKSRRHTFRNTQVGGINFHADNEIYIYDLAKEHGLVAKLKNYLSDAGRGKSIYMIEFHDDVTRTRWMEEYDLKYVSTKLASSLPAPPRKIRTSTSTGLPVKRGPNRTDMDAWLIDPSYCGNKTHEKYMRPTKIEKKHNDGGIYIEATNKLTGLFNNGKIRYVKTAAKDAKQLGFDEDIYAIKTKDIQNLGDGWQNFEEVFIPFIEEIISQYTDDDIKEAHQARTHTYNEVFSYLTILKDGLIKHLSIDSPLRKYILASNEIEMELKNQQKYLTACNSYGYLVGHTVKETPYYDGKGCTHAVVAMKNAVKGRYPLFNQMNTYVGNNISAKDMAEYINLMDAKLKEEEKESKVA
jgi:hypothetical protein